jgi:ribosomal protein S12 methylthiotransferase accessory factor
MEIFVMDVRHPVLAIPAFYTIIPGTQFRERATHSCVGMIIAKIISNTHSPLQAIEKLSQFDTVLPDKYYLQFYLGHAYLNLGNFETALSYFEKALRLEPPDEDLASVYTYLGVCYKEKEQYHNAEKVLARGHQIDPERTDTLNLLGFCHYKKKKHEQAIDCFKKLIALDPSSAIDYANVASNYRAMGEKAKAIEYYQLALALDSNIDFAKKHLLQLGVQV